MFAAASPGPRLESCKARQATTPASKPASNPAPTAHHGLLQLLAGRWWPEAELALVRQRRICSGRRLPQPGAARLSLCRLLLLLLQQQQRLPPLLLHLQPHLLQPLLPLLPLPQQLDVALVARHRHPVVPALVGEAVEGALIQALPLGLKLLLRLRQAWRRAPPSSEQLLLYSLQRFSCH